MPGDIIHDQLHHFDRRVVHRLTPGIELVAAGARRAVVVEAEGKACIGRQFLPVPPDGEDTLPPRTGDVNPGLDPGDVVKIVVLFLGMQKAVRDPERSAVIEVEILCGALQRLPQDFAVDADGCEGVGIDIRGDDVTDADGTVKSADLIAETDSGEARTGGVQL